MGPIGPAESLRVKSDMELKPEENPYAASFVMTDDPFHSEEEERDRTRRRYVLCRLGFGLLAFALALATFSIIAQLWTLFFGRQPFGWLIMSPFWRWINAPIVWASLVGVYLLWGRWRQPAWQRRVGLLLLMSLVDAGLWILDHTADIGLPKADHAWLRSHLGQGLGWVEFIVIASLACGFLAHLGVERAPDAAKSTRALCFTGAFIWTIVFLQCTKWGWPLEPRRMNNAMELLLVSIGIEMLWATILIQVTAMTVAAARRASRALAELRKESEIDHFRPRDDDFFSNGDGKQRRGPWDDFA